MSGVLNEKWSGLTRLVKFHPFFPFCDHRWKNSWKIVVLSPVSTLSVCEDLRPLVLALLLLRVSMVTFGDGPWFRQAFIKDTNVGS